MSSPRRRWSLGVGAGFSGLMVFLAALSLGGLTSCVHLQRRADDRFEHTSNHYTIGPPDYTIGAPEQETGAWESVGMGGVDLAFRGPDRETITLFSSCRDEERSPRLLARQLTKGLSPLRRLHSGEVEVAGHRGWQQVVETEFEGRLVTMKTVTVVVQKCSYDWVLVAGDSYESVVASFDAWWSSVSFSGSKSEKGW